MQSSRYLVPTLQMVHLMLAISVRIQGLNVTPTLSKSNPRPLLTAVNNACQYFNQQHPTTDCINEKYIGKLITHILFSSTYYIEVVLFDVLQRHFS